jgi:acyl-CoA thioester hydrolase
LSDTYQDSLIHLPIRPNDYDYACYLNNAVYVEYLEAGRVAWAALNGINLFEPSIAPAVSRLELNYLKGLIRGQDAPAVNILTHLIEMKPVRLLFQQTISNAEEEICARANLEIVMVNLQTKKAMPVRTALDRLKGR